MKEAGPKRSRSPLRRAVKFAEPLARDIPASSGDPIPGLMRMAEARDAVPRNPNESRTEWKKRIFDFKRSEEAKHGKGGGGKGTRPKKK